MHIWKHFKTITKHRHMVMKQCFEIGLYKQGLLHDLSKYSPTEFSKGCIYYQGDRSPNNYEREVTGVTLSWLHHKGRNRHHFEYWLDYDLEHYGQVTGMVMPRKYVAEMFCDRLAACRIYEKENYTSASPVRFFYRGAGSCLMHVQTRREIAYLLTMFSVKEKEETFAYIRNEYLKGAEIPESFELYRSIAEFDRAYELGEVRI